MQYLQLVDYLGRLEVDNLIDRLESGRLSVPNYKSCLRRNPVGLDKQNPFHPLQGQSKEKKC